MAGSIGFGMYDVGIAGGVEHMGRHPMGANADPNPRFVAEKLVERRRPQHGHHGRAHPRPLPAPHQGARRPLRHAAASTRSQAAYDAGKIQPDLVPVAIRSDGGWGLATEDEGMRPETTMEGLAALKTPFRPHGRVTAGNVSPLTDGATMSLLAGGDAAKELGLQPKMKLVTFAFAGVAARDHGHRPDPVAPRRR